MRRVAQAVILYLPPPISTNALTRSVTRGRSSVALTSAAYRQWKAEAAAMILQQKLPCVLGAYGLRVAVPRKCRVDLDNCLKAILDALHQNGIVENDSPKYFV